MSGRTTTTLILPLAGGGIPLTHQLASKVHLRSLFLNILVLIHPIDSIEELQQQ